MTHFTEIKHLKLIYELINSKATVEDIAHAMASVDGKDEDFTAEAKLRERRPDLSLYYEAYIVEAEEILTRAASYARRRETDQA